MLKLEDLWIGDLVQIISSGKVGKYEGKTDDGNAKIRHYDKLISAAADDLKKYFHVKKEIVVDVDELEDPPAAEADAEIDLHIEVLNPNLIGARPERIIDFQVKAFQAYLGKLKDNFLNEAVIIHGKGEGILKAEVMSIIRNDKAVRHYEEIHDGGAVRILVQS